MSTLDRLRQVAGYRERLAKLALAEAERDRAHQQGVVDRATRAVEATLLLDGSDAGEQVNRHTWALRLELHRRSAEDHLRDRTRDVGHRREAAVGLARERGTLDRLVERRAEDDGRRTFAADCARLDEAGLQGWWRKGA